MKIFLKYKGIGFEAGFTVVEVIVAIFVVTVGIGGLVAFIQFSEFTTRDAVVRLTAAYLAQEGLEAVRQIRDSNLLEVHRGGAGTWQNNGLSEAACASGCQLICRQAGTYYPFCGAQGGNIDIELVPFADEFLTQENGYYAQSSPIGQATPFKRKITITEGAADRLDVSVEVSWTLPRNTGSVTAATQLYDWLPAP